MPREVFHARNSLSHIPFSKAFLHFRHCSPFPTKESTPDKHPQYVAHGRLSQQTARNAIQPLSASVGNQHPSTDNRKAWRENHKEPLMQAAACCH